MVVFWVKSVDDFCVYLKHGLWIDTVFLETVLGNIPMSQVMDLQSTLLFPLRRSKMFLS